MFKNHPYISLYVFGSVSLSAAAFLNVENVARISGGFLIFGTTMIALAVVLGIIGKSNEN